VIAVAVAIGYSAVGSLVLLFAVQKLVGLRLDAVRESAGMDHSLHGEAGYGMLNLN
jgi:Amt family ammonium transporter